MSEQQVLKSRRSYNRWVANETLEDYALRFTAKSARRWSAARVSNTALGAISFLALEAIGGAITLLYGFNHAIIAIMVVSLVIFLSGLPICYYAAKYGVDIDLLSRGAGFGYIGSTITSLIYASFTFIFFALEAAIMASALELIFKIPITVGYLLSSVVIIPLATHGITFISRFQLWSQPLWLVLQIAPFIFILHHEWSATITWMQYKGAVAPADNAFNMIYFGAASGVLFALIAQIGEQVDFLRFLPKPDKTNRRRWWLALMAAGPGWIIIGALKIIAGSFLAVLALNNGVAFADANDPTHMYLVAFSYMTESPLAAMALAGLFVIVCQLKINVTNAYAGSIAWSNFFSRLTHSHPGRVVWLVFNVVIALLLMELGIYQTLESILTLYSIVAVAWVSTLVADLVVNKPLGYSPAYIEFKRAHLYDINPVGFGAMIIASVIGILCYTGLFGEWAKAMSHYITLVAALVISPAIAIITKGRYYIAREVTLDTAHHDRLRCKLCDNVFEVEDMTTCPAYHGNICSLCCSIDAHCHDQCKVGARFGDQLTSFVSVMLPQRLVSILNARLLHFFGLFILLATVMAMMFLLVYQQVSSAHEGVSNVLAVTLVQIFILLMIVVGILIWLFVLASESRSLALEESQRQTLLLSKEVTAHKKTDHELQNAKEVAEAANQAKSRYLTGISHELRSPLNTILGYTQLLERDRNVLPEHQKKISLIRRSGEHLADLIEGLLDISRIEAGRLELRRDRVSLPVLLEELTDMFSLQAQAKGIEFEYHLKSHIPEVVMTDEKHLRQILINLLSNAVKFTERGKVVFSAHYRNEVIELIVNDTGCGIHQDDIEIIYHPFERIRKPGHVQAPGTGLGLTITKFLTEIMGGEITVDSQPGQGSQFKLSLMLPRVSTMKPIVEHHRAIKSFQEDTKVIMVVDDDSNHRDILEEILKPLGFDVLHAVDADGCLQAIQNREIDLFLLDISMPGISGWELAEKLRSIGVHAPIMMVSADAIEGPEYARQQYEQTKLINDYLIKPIQYPVLLEKLAQLLNLQWQFSGIETENSMDSSESQTLKISSNDVNAMQYREIISLAELGFVDGMQKIMDEIAETRHDVKLHRRMQGHLDSFQFDEMIKLCKRMLVS
jgi:signal transduction histidine kinase/CheY-like chemotaxis protein